VTLKSLPNPLDPGLVTQGQSCLLLEPVLCQQPAVPMRLTRTCLSHYTKQT
jgi:hypothetical protein